MATNIVNSMIGSRAADRAAKKQVAATEKASKQQKQQYELTRGDLLKNYETDTTNFKPFLNTGTSANNQLGYAMGLGGTGAGEAGALAKPFTMADYEADPGYQFRLSEGMKALDRVSSAKGKYFSGGAVKALTDYNQGMAHDEYKSAYDRYNTNQTNLYNRLAGLSQTGMNAASSIANSGANTQSQLNNSGQNYVNNISSNSIQAGNAQAAGTIGSAQAWITGINGIKNDAAMAAGMAGSDIRIKENIQKVSKDKGFNIYEFNYKGYPQRYRGVMAQEVQETRPDAVSEINGVLHVFYDLIGLKMEAV